MAEATASGELERRLGLSASTNIVISNMVGAGIFTTSGLLMGDLHNPWIMIILWIAGGILALCGALCYSELGAAIPQAGGEYVFLSRLFHPLFGFLSGWVSFVVGFSAPIAAAAIGCTEYLLKTFPHLAEWGLITPWLPVATFKKILSVLIILLVTLIHLRGVKFSAKFQTGCTWMEMAVITGLAVGGFCWGKGDVNHFVQGGGFSFGFTGWKTLGLSMMWIMFAYSGWNASTYIASEIIEPAKTLPRSLLLGTGIIILLYVGLNVFFVYAIPPNDMKGVISIASLAAGNAFGPFMIPVFSLLIAFALFSSLSAFTILGPRVYYSMARDGYFFKFAAKIHPVFQVPTRAILLQGALSSVLVLSGTFDQILTYLGFSLGIFPILAVFGVFQLRRSNLSRYRMPGYPLVPAVYMLAGLCMLVLSFCQRPGESSLSLFTVLAGIPAFFIFKKRQS
jgi:APA family basic amino acid/polyamine antiporter